MDDSLHYLIMANQMLVQKALLYKLKDTGLTIGQPKILDYLSRHNGSNQKEIAKACFLEAGSLTTILNKMEEKGLIRRQILNGNRRSFHIFMTEEGKKKQQLVSEAFSEIEGKAVEGISKEEIEGFLAVYQKIYANLLDEADLLSKKNLLKDEKRQERDYEQIKEVHIIFNRAICKCTGSQSGDKSESWYVTNLIDPICIKPEFPIYTGKFYNRVQYFADR